MLVSQVQEFIKALVNIEPQLGIKDQKLLDVFQKKFPLPSKQQLLDNTSPYPNDVLSEEALQWLKGIFADRWHAIADTSEDYTFDPRGNSSIWVNLAKALAVDLDQHYLAILIPVITNKSELDCNQDPRSVVLSEEGPWFRVEKLFEKMQVETPPPSDQPKLSRALTLKEMFRIRSKRGDEELERRINDKIYTSFWDYLIRRVVPTWETKGRCPEHLLPSLLKLIECYFEDRLKGTNEGPFNQQFTSLDKELKACSLDDVNHFYGIKVYSETREFYLIEVLLDCFEKTESLQEKFADLARCLSRINPRLVSTCQSLVPLYETQRVGKYFDSQHLLKLISKLDTGIDGIEPRVQQLVRALNEAGKITEIAIEQIKDLYAWRWKQVIDTPNDYLRTQTNENYGWIRLAQYLAGAGCIDANYYQLLIPTLKYKKIAITTEKITNYSLHNFILSGDETDLIYLPHCIKYHQENDNFYCYATQNKQFRALGEKEKERLRYAPPAIYQYYVQVLEKEEKENLPISKRTVMALRELINGTLNPEATLYGFSITVEQEQIALAAYGKFMEFVHKLPKDERERLYTHTFMWDAKKQSVSKIFAGIQHPNEQNERMCIARAGQLLAKLVIDYVPEHRFSFTIEKAPYLSLKKMRTSSAKIVFRDWEMINDNEAKRRALIIIVSLMTHHFKCMWFTGVTQEFEGYSNKITETGQALFKIVAQALALNDFSTIRFNYTYTMQKIVEEALSQKKHHQYENTLQWLKSIQDQSIFKPENCCCFEPKLILVTLVPFLNEPGVRGPLGNFLERLVNRLILQPQSTDLQWVLINIDFNKFLETVAPFRHRFLISLRKSKQMVKDEECLKQLSVFFAYKLSYIGASINKSQGLFGTNPGRPTSFKEIENFLSDQVALLLPKEDLTLEEMLAEIIKALKSSIQKFERSSAMNAYLDSFKQNLIRQNEDSSSNCFSFLRALY
jgi:hypothetical protein